MQFVNFLKLCIKIISLSSNRILHPNLPLNNDRITRYARSKTT